MWMSMRSSSGPEIRFWYLVTTAEAHVQGFCVSPKYPQGQGYTQFDILFVFGKWQKADIKSTFQDFKSDVWLNNTSERYSLRHNCIWVLIPVYQICTPPDRSDCGYGPILVKTHSFRYRYNPLWITETSPFRRVFVWTGPLLPVAFAGSREAAINIIRQPPIQMLSQFRSELRRLLFAVPISTRTTASSGWSALQKKY